MSDDPVPEPDRIDGAPHPRETLRLFGQDKAEAAFLTTLGTGRLHHAWLLSGPRGIGKATLAWRIARHLARDDPGPTLDMDPDHPVWRRSQALAEPRIRLCRRAWDDKAKRLKTQLGVEEIRGLKGAFALTAAEGGWRAAIIDAVDELNTAAANALLKLLEEPPARTILLLVCHQPGRVLPTILSRTRRLPLATLAPEDLARALLQAGQPAEEADLLHRLTRGSAGDAIRFLQGDGPEIARAIADLLDAAPQMDRAAIAALAARAAGRDNAHIYEIITRLTGLALADLARAGAGHAPDASQADADRAARLCPGPAAARGWAATQQALTERIGHARAVNLDPEQVILDMFLSIETTAAQWRHAGG
ncbi:MAG: DNA polymerase III subunit delta' [Pseudomonadota bacterium]